MRYKAEKIAEKIPIVEGNYTLYDIIRILADSQVPIIVVNGSYITIDSIVKILVHNRDKLHEKLSMQPLYFTSQLHVFLKRVSFKNIISKIYVLKDKYAILKADKINIIGGITPRSLFSYFSRYFLLNDMNYFYKWRFRCVVTPNTTIIGILKKMMKFKSNFSAVVFRGKFRGIISSYDIMKFLLSEEILSKIENRKDEYFYETSVVDLFMLYKPAIDIVHINAYKIRHILATYSVLAVLRNGLLEYFVDDNCLINYIRKKLINRWFDAL